MTGPWLKVGEALIGYLLLFIPIGCTAIHLIMYFYLKKLYRAAKKNGYEHSFFVYYVFDIGRAPINMRGYYLYDSYPCRLPTWVMICYKSISIYTAFTLMVWAASLAAIFVFCFYCLAFGFYEYIFVVYIQRDYQMAIEKDGYGGSYWAFARIGIDDPANTGKASYPQTMPINIRRAYRLRRFVLIPIFLLIFLTV